jgi:AAA+ superfamily predicted ATPase
MKVTPVQQNSETVLMTDIHKLADAGASVIQVRTREPMRTAVILRKNLIGGESPYYEWDVVNGTRVFTLENFVDHKVTGQPSDFFEALSRPLIDLRNQNSQVNLETNKIHFFAYIDPHPFIQSNPVVIEMIQQYAAILPSTNVCILLITPDMPLSDIPTGTMLVAELPTPNTEELEAILERIVGDAIEQEDDRSHKTFPDGSDLDEEDITRIANLGLGLSLYEFETYAAIAVIDANLSGERAITFERMQRGIAQGKTVVVKQSEILELTMPEDISNVGGMHRLKDWLGKRAGCYSEEAKEAGVEPPKGIALVGVPGTGKSLIAKAIGSILGVPIVRLDFGRVFSKFVGDSESRVRNALSMVEAMAPCVLFVDEIDKGLGGIGSGGGDAGTSSRVLGSFLSWLQDCKAPVFTMVTANRIDGLPPELLRRGRFDQIFSVAMPNDIERREVLAIHMRKRGKDIDSFSDAQVRQILEASRDYVPAEIESAVKDALVEAFSAGEELSSTHVVSALHEMIPMSKSHKAQIDRIVDWARENATPVNYDGAQQQASAAITKAAGGRRLIRSNRSQ